MTNYELIVCDYGKEVDWYGLICPGSIVENEKEWKFRCGIHEYVVEKKDGRTIFWRAR